MPVCSEKPAPLAASNPDAPLALVIQMARLGDFLQSTPLIRAVRHKHPHNRIAALVTPAQAPLARGCPDLDVVLELEPGPLHETLQSNRMTGEQKSLAWRQALTGLPEMEVEHFYNLNLGPVGGLLGREWPGAEPHAWRLNDELNALSGEPWSPFIMSMAGHRSLTRLHLTDILSAYADPPQRPADSLCHEPSLKALTKARELVGDARPLVALQLGANSFLRRWPVESFGELALSLILQGARPVLVGSSGESALGRRLLARLGPAGERVIDLMGRTSLAELGAVLSLCNLVVSADTGTLHLATAVGSTVLALFMGPAQLHETGPYGQGHLVFQARDHCGPCQEQNPVCRGKSPCRRLIRPGEVIQAAGRLLQGRDAHGAVAGLDFPEGVRPYVGRQERFGQAYAPLDPAPLTAEEGLALALRQAGLALLYSAYRPESITLAAGIRRAGAAPLPEEKKLIESHLAMLAGSPDAAEAARLGFLARLKGPKAPPRAETALRLMRETLEICLGS